VIKSGELTKKIVIKGLIATAGAKAAIEAAGGISRVIAEQVEESVATTSKLAKSAASGFPWSRLWFLLGSLIVFTG